MHEQLTFLLNELRSAWRFRWLALVAAWVLALGGWGAVANMPDQFEATARVYVDTTSELREIIGNQIIESDVDAQLAFVRQALLGRVQLEEVARQSDLALRAENSQQFDTLVDRLRNGVEISVSGDGRRRGPENLYTIRYKDHDRDMALSVVDTILTTFVEDTMGGRRERSASARQFLERQVREYEQRLAESEERLAAFRREHADVLPGSEGNYFNRLQNETAALEEAEQRLELAESRRNRLQQRLRAASTGIELPADGEDAPAGSIDARIREAEDRLEELLLRFTDRHPDVVATRETLERLRERREEQLAAMADGDGVAAGASTNPVYQALQISLNEIEVEIASLEADLRRRQNRVDRLRAAMDEVPEVEAQLARLNRDYDVVNAQYQSLLASLETERLTREARETDQVEFRVIDPPSAPNSPVAPNRPVLLLGMLFFGLGGGGGLAFLLSQLRPVFPTPKVLHEATGLPVIGSVSLTWRERHRTRRRAELFSFALGCVALGGVFAGVYLVEVAGPGLYPFVQQGLNL